MRGAPPRAEGGEDVGDEKLLRKLLDRLPRGGFRLTDLGVIHDENVICKIT